MKSCCNKKNVSIPYVCQGPEEFGLSWHKYKMVVGDLGSNTYGVNGAIGSFELVDSSEPLDPELVYLYSEGNNTLTKMQFNNWNYYYVSVYIDNVKQTINYNANGSGYADVAELIFTSADVGQTFCVTIEHQAV